MFRSSAFHCIDFVLLSNKTNNQIPRAGGLFV